MAFSFQGIGTKFYGQRDFRLDGSYITTEWFIFVYLPLFPLKSIRVRHQGSESGFFPIQTSTEHYEVLEKTPINLKQVVFTYLFVVSFIVWIFLSVQIVATRLENAMGTTGGSWLWLAIALIPAGIPHLLRFLAKKRLTRQLH